MDNLSISASWSLQQSQDYLICISLRVGNIYVSQLFQTTGVKVLTARELKQATLYTLQNLKIKSRPVTTRYLMPLTELPKGRIFPLIGLEEKSLTAKDFSQVRQRQTSGNLIFEKPLVALQTQMSGI